MICPVCGKSTHIEIDTHSDGFAPNLQECGACGALWTCKEEKQILLHTGLARVVNG